MPHCRVPDFRPHQETNWDEECRQDARGFYLNADGKRRQCQVFIDPYTERGAACRRTRIWSGARSIIRCVESPSFLFTPDDRELESSPLQSHIGSNSRLSVTMHIRFARSTGALSISPIEVLVEPPSIAASLNEFCGCPYRFQKKGQKSALL